MVIYIHDLVQKLLAIPFQFYLVWYLNTKARLKICVYVVFSKTTLLKHMKP